MNYLCRPKISSKIAEDWQMREGSGRGGVRFLFICYAENIRNYAPKYEINRINMREIP
jgi:hypothetical protein